MSSQKRRGNPARGEIWEADFDPTVGREQSGRRPVLIVSDNALNSGPRGLVIVVPVTGTATGVADSRSGHAPRRGLTKPSVIMTEQIRSVSKNRLGLRRGKVTQETMEKVDQILRILLGL